MRQGKTQSEVGIYKRRQESKNTRKQELDQESDQETRKIERNQEIDQEKTFFILDHFLGRVLVFFLFFLFLDRFLGRVLVFFYKFPPQFEIGSITKQVLR